MFLFPEIATSITTHVPSSLSRIIMSGSLIGMVVSIIIIIIIIIIGRTQWPCGLRRGDAAAPLLGLQVRIPPGAWISVSCDCWLLSGRWLCVGLITRPEESYEV